jgi:hypothetical protein
VGLENADALAAIDTLTNKVIGMMPIGQAPQAVVYVPDAVPQGDGKASLVPLGVAGETTHLALGAVGKARGGAAPTSVALFEQGLSQVLQASVTGLQPKQPYVLALADNAAGKGKFDVLPKFMTNPAGSAIVNALGQIRQVVQADTGRNETRRYLVIAPLVDDRPGRRCRCNGPWFLLAPIKRSPCR